MKLCGVCIFVLMTTLVISGVTGVSQPKTTEARLFRDLFENYDPRVRPVLQYQTVLEVNIQLFLCMLIDIDERNQAMITNLWLRMIWKDQLLTWEPEKYENITKLYPPINSLWIPDIVFRNSARDPKPEEFLYPMLNLQLYSNGTVDFFSVGDLETVCNIDVTYFPFDYQHCMIKIESWSHEGKIMKLTGQDHIRLDLYKDNGQWEIVDSRMITKETYDLASEPLMYYHIESWIVLKRKPLYFTANVVIPCIIMSFMVCLVFCVPVENGEKISLSITILLSFTVFLLLVAGHMPKTSESLPILSIYLTFIMVMSATSIVMTLFVLNINFNSGDVPIPPLVKKILYVLEKVTWMRHKKLPVRKLCEVNMDITNHLIHSSDIQAQGTTLEQDEAGDQTEMVNTVKEILKEIKAMSDIRKEVTESDGGGCYRNQWIRAAQILDRFLLLVYVGTTVVVTAILLGVFPRLQNRDMDIKN